MPEGNEAAIQESIGESPSAPVVETSFATDTAETPTLESLQAQVKALEAAKSAAERRAETYRGNLEPLRAQQAQYQAQLQALEKRIAETEMSKASSDLEMNKLAWREEGYTQAEIDRKAALYEQEMDLRRRQQAIDQLRPYVEQTQRDIEIQEYFKDALVAANATLTETGLAANKLTLAEIAEHFPTQPKSAAEIERKLQKLIAARIKESATAGRKETLKARAKDGVDSPVPDSKVAITDIKAAERAYALRQIDRTEFEKHAVAARKAGVPGYN